MDTKIIQRVYGSYYGRNRSSAYQDLVFTVATAESLDGDIQTQTKATLEKIERNLIELGSNKHQILSAQVYLANISDKPV
ncbi:hypothetical protein [Pseudomonas sp. EA_35y_Pfl2_R5]|uniref:hypothetical protein n=1 Tax=Pseudomonas sp. EA_35y_Pfl2_R5 TaxID=3088690 RepID=UPI0030D9D293